MPTTPTAAPGGDGAPLVLLQQHFRGKLDNWDPALIGLLSARRRVIAFDNVGVGGSSGSTPRTVAETADGAIGFLDALALREVDVLGYSLGSFVAQAIAPQPAREELQIKDVARIQPNPTPV